MGLFGDIGQVASGGTGLAADAIFSLIGQAQASGDWQKATALYQQYLQQVQNTTAPDWQNQNAQTQDSNYLISGDGQGKSAQSQAIQQLQSLASQGGLDAQARQANQQVLSQQDQNDQAQRGALMQSYARKGMGGSNAELGAALQGQQGNANAARDSGLNIAGQARQRALSALTQSGQLGTSMRGQDIGVEQANQSAQTARDQFNAKMRSAADQNNAQGRLDTYGAQLAQLQAMGKANDAVAKDWERQGKQTQGTYSAVGRGLDDSFQGAGEGSADQPW